MRGGLRCEDKDEREAFYNACKLPPDVAATLEEYIGKGRLTTSVEKEPTSFSLQLNAVLERLSAAGVSTVALEECSKRLAEDVNFMQQKVLRGVSFVASELSKFRTGMKNHGKPSAPKMRALVFTLEDYVNDFDQEGHSLRQSDVDALVASFGTTREELMESSDRVIARINEKTTIKRLLRDITTAADTSVSDAELSQTSPTPVRGGRGVNLPIKPLDLTRWMSEAQKFDCPTAQEAKALMQRLNTVRKSHHYPAYTVGEIEAVVAVAARDRQKVEETPVSDRQEQPRVLITPSIVIDNRSSPIAAVS